MTALAARPERTRGLRILSSAVPGINRMALDELDPSAEVTGLFMQPGLRQAQRDVRFRHLPLSFAGPVDHVRERVTIDPCVVHVAPPDAAGRCSLGAAVEFTPLVQAKSARTFALINPNMPAIPGAVQGDFIPTMSLGISGDAVMALILGALVIQGIQPGPQLTTEHPDVFWGLIASFWIGNILLVTLNVPTIGIWVKRLQIPFRYLFPFAFFMCVGVYSTNNEMFGVVQTLVIGVVGYGLLRLGFHPAPILLGFVLGPRLEERSNLTHRYEHVGREDPPRAAERSQAGDLVWLAVLWIFASVLGSLAAAICFDFASLALRTWAFVHEAPGSVASGLAAAAGAHSVLLWATWRRAAIVGQGDRSAGLGNTVTRRRWLVPVAFVVKLGAIAGTTVSMGVVLPGPPFKDPEHQVMALAWAQGPVLAVLNILWATIIAPLAEESFFRGWLWTGLRRHWSPGWTGVVTGGLWIFVHIGSGLPKMVALIPAAVIYSVVRHYRGSVRATIVLHVLNNSLAVASSLFIDISE